MLNRKGQRPSPRTPAPLLSSKGTGYVLNGPLLLSASDYWKNRLFNPLPQIPEHRCKCSQGSWDRRA